MKKLDNEINAFFQKLEERFEACCDKEVANLLKDVIFEDLKQKKTFNLSDQTIKKRIDEIIEKRF